MNSVGIENYLAAKLYRSSLSKGLLPGTSSPSAKDANTSKQEYLSGKLVTKKQLSPSNFHKHDKLLFSFTALKIYYFIICIN